jgi:hypothetical protein
MSSRKKPRRKRRPSCACGNKRRAVVLIDGPRTGKQTTTAVCFNCLTVFTTRKSVNGPVAPDTWPMLGGYNYLRKLREDYER